MVKLISLHAGAGHNIYHVLISPWQKKVMQRWSVCLWTTLLK